MQIKELEGYIGFLRKDHQFKLNQKDLAVSLAILEAYKKGLQRHYLVAEDLLVDELLVKNRSFNMNIKPSSTSTRFFNKTYT